MKHSGGRESFERLGIEIFFHTGIWNLGTRIFFQYRDWYPSTRDFHCMASLIKTPVRIFEEPNQLSFQGGSFLYPILARRGMKTIFLIKIPYFREFSAQYATVWGQKKPPKVNECTLWLIIVQPWFFSYKIASIRTFFLTVIFFVRSLSVYLFFAIFRFSRVQKGPKNTPRSTKFRF